MRQPAAIVLAMAALLAPATNVRADLTVDPALVLFSGAEHGKAISLQNPGKGERTYRVSLVDRRMLPDGRLVEDPAAPEQGTASRLVRFSPRQVTLSPGQSATVRFLLHAPADLPDGEYRSHVLVQQVPEIILAEPPHEDGKEGVPAIELRAVFGVVIPLIVRRGALPLAASLSEIRLVDLPDGGGRALAFRVNRSGARSVGGTIGFATGGRELTSFQNLWIYNPAPYREVVLPLAALSPAALSGRLELSYREDEEAPGAVLARGAIDLP